jgi:hypothetical protein
MPIDVSAYESMILNIWRGPVAPVSTGTFSLTAEESTDQDTWTTVSGISAVAGTTNTEVQVTGTLVKRWMRVKVTLTGTDPAATCWALGFLVQRQP